MTVIERKVGTMVLKRHRVIQLGFLHDLEDVEHFGREVLPIVRQLEAAELERV